LHAGDRPGRCVVRRTLGLQGRPHRLPRTRRAREDPPAVDRARRCEGRVARAREGDQSAVASVQYGYDSTAVRPVKPGEGTSGPEVLQFNKPGWTTRR